VRLSLFDVFVGTVRVAAVETLCRQKHVQEKSVYKQVCK
jgi:hypothetical protein